MASFRIGAGDRRVQDAGLRERGHVRVGKLAAAVGIAEPAAAHVPAFGPGRRSGPPTAAADSPPPPPPPPSTLPSPPPSSLPPLSPTLAGVAATPTLSDGAIAGVAIGGAAAVAAVAAVCVVVARRRLPPATTGRRTWRCRRADQFCVGEKTRTPAHIISTTSGCIRREARPPRRTEASADLYSLHQALQRLLFLGGQRRANLLERRRQHAGRRAADRLEALAEGGLRRLRRVQVGLRRARKVQLRVQPW